MGWMGEWEGEASVHFLIHKIICAFKLPIAPFMGQLLVIIVIVLVVVVVVVFT